MRCGCCVRGALKRIVLNLKKGRVPNLFKVDGGREKQAGRVIGQREISDKELLEVSRIPYDAA